MDVMVPEEAISMLGQGLPNEIQLKVQQLASETIRMLASSTFVGTWLATLTGPSSLYDRSGIRYS